MSYGLHNLKDELFHYQSVGITQLLLFLRHESNSDNSFCQLAPFISLSVLRKSMQANNIKLSTGVTKAKIQAGGNCCSSLWFRILHLHRRIYSYKDIDDEGGKNRRGMLRWPE